MYSYSYSCHLNNIHCPTAAVAGIQLAITFLTRIAEELNDDQKHSRDVTSRRHFNRSHNY